MLPSWQCLNGEVGRSGCHQQSLLALGQKTGWTLNKNTNPRYELKTQILEWEPDMDSTEVNSLRRSPLGLKEKKGGQNSTHDCIYGDIILVRTEMGRLHHGTVGSIQDREVEKCASLDQQG